MYVDSYSDKALCRDELGVLDYNTESLARDNEGHHVWKVLQSLHVKDFEWLLLDQNWIELLVFNTTYNIFLGITAVNFISGENQSQYFTDCIGRCKSNYHTNTFNNISVIL